MDEKVFVFWHVCSMNNWRDIALDQYETIRSSGLLDRAEGVFVTYLGPEREDVAWLEAKSKKIRVENHSPQFNHYERMCLNGLKDWSEGNDGLVLYLHTKGVSRVQQKGNVWKWRKLLEYFLVENHERCTEKMADLDTLGGNLCSINRKPKDLDRPGHSLHYSGNFWWARTAHLRSLPRIPEDVRMELNGNYIRYCEFWLLRAFPKVRCGVLFKTEEPHYYKRPPEIDFRKGWL